MFNAEVFTFLNLACVAIMLGLARWFESRTGKIPNLLNAVCLLLGVALCVRDGLLSVHLGGFLMASVIGFSHFILGIIPGGMAKLIIGVGAIAGPASPMGIYAYSILMMAWTRYQAQKANMSSDVPRQSDLPGQIIFQGSAVVATGTILGIAALLVIRSR